MTYTGTVSKGIVILPPEAKIPDGTKVRVEPIEDVSRVEPVGKRLLALVGSADQLPEDFAQNHDHYIHGAPRRSAP
jgi:virulence-associated protein VagC